MSENAKLFKKYGVSQNSITRNILKDGLTTSEFDKYIKQSIEKIKENQIEPDFVSALKLCKRRRIGAIRPEANRELFYKKDMGILARAGFSFEMSKRVLSLPINLEHSSYIVDKFCEIYKNAF